MWWMRTCAGCVFRVTLANRLLIKENELLVWPSFIWPSTSIIHMHTRTHWHCTQWLKRGRWLSNSIQNILAKGQEEQNDRNMIWGEMVQCSWWCSVHVREQLARQRHLTKSERALCDTNIFYTGTTLFVINYPLAWNVSECVSSVLLDGHPVVEHAVIFTDDDTHPVQSYRGFTLMQPAWARSILTTVWHPKRSSRGATWSAMVITSVIRLTWQISPSKIERRSFLLTLDDGKLIISTQRRMSSNPRLVTEGSWKTPMQWCQKF